MPKLRTWIICYLVVIAYLFYHHFRFSPLSKGDLFPYEDLIIAICLVVGSGALVALPVALIPFKKGLNYFFRWLLMIPYSTIFICLLMTMLLAKGGLFYNAIEPEPGTNCNSIKEGYFYYTDHIVYRHGNSQTDFNLKTNKKEIIPITWINDHEYVLAFKRADTRVKVVHVDSLGYDCYLQFKSRALGKIRMSKIKNINMKWSGIIQQ